MSETGPVEPQPDRTLEVPEAPPLTRSSVDRWTPPRATARPQRASFVGMAGMAMVLFLILASGSVIPWWGLVLLTLVWAMALLQGVRWFMSHPGRVVALPVAMVALWLAVLYGGAVLLDWG
jgi:hypothetical protein